MVRHKSVTNLKEFKKFVEKSVPSDIYHSCAYYENPEADMDKKGWFGADLVFDIDADHIPTPCNKIHDEWSCSKCGFEGKGPSPENCPACGSQKFDTRTWPCEVCLSSAKEETQKLVDILKTEFGFSNTDLHLFFSGHRGYHVHIETEEIKTLDSIARREIVDYVYGLGLSYLSGENLERRSKDRGREFLSLPDLGWNLRLKQGIKRFLRDASMEDLTKISLKPNIARLLKSKETQMHLEEERWEKIKGVGNETWKTIAKKVRDLESAKIDTVVTTDLHRLIRMNGTLHGKTGLKKIEFPVSAIEYFDPLKEAVAFKEGQVKVFVSSAPEFQLDGNVFGPYKNETVDLPTAAALFLVCKGRAEVK